MDEKEDRRTETDHWVRDAGKASMYGFTMRSYNAGVSRTMWTCCLEYCTKKKGGGRGFLKILVRVVNHGMNDLANVHVSCRINDINLDVWPVL
jgi:hypothetical protein